MSNKTNKSKFVEEIMSYINSLQNLHPYEFDNELWVELEDKVHKKAVYATRTARRVKRWAYNVGDELVIHSMRRSRDFGNRNGIVGVVTEVDNYYNTVKMTVKERKMSRHTLGDTISVPFENVKRFELPATEETAPKVEVQTEKSEDALRLESLYNFLGA